MIEHIDAVNGLLTAILFLMGTVGALVASLTTFRLPVARLMTRLGNHYYQKRPVNRKRALHFYKIAANMGEREAEYFLSRMYELGKGVKRDRRTAKALRYRAINKHKLNITTVIYPHNELAPQKRPWPPHTDEGGSNSGGDKGSNPGGGKGSNPGGGKGPNPGGGKGPNPGEGNGSNSSREPHFGKIKCLQGTYKGMEITLEPGQGFVIGRSQECAQLILPDNNVSRKHCLIEYTGTPSSTYYVTDYSTMGTFVNNGIRLDKNQKRQVSAGTRLTLATGDNVFVFCKPYLKKQPGEGTDQ